MPQDINNVRNYWVMVPAPWRIAKPPGPHDPERWQMTLTGTADINFQGNATSAWRREVFKLHLDWKSPVLQVSRNPEPSAFEMIFQAEQWVPFATINSIYDAAQSIHAGYAVDACHPLLVERYQWGETTPIRNVFEGLEVHVAVRDTDACLYKVGFQVMLVGRIIPLHIRQGM